MISGKIEHILKQIHGPIKLSKVKIVGQSRVYYRIIYVGIAISQKTIIKLDDMYEILVFKPNSERKETHMMSLQSQWFSA